MQPSERQERLRVYRGLWVAAACFVVAWALWSARGALFPFFVGLVLAYLLAPLVNQLQRLFPERGVVGRARRTLAILLVYLLMLAIIAGAVVTVGAKLAQETLDLVDALPAYVDEARDQQSDWQQWYETEVPAGIREQIENNIDAISSTARSGVTTALTTTFGTARRVFGFLAGLALLPLWLYYVLKDDRKAKAFFYGLWPPSLQPDVRAIAGIIDRVLAAYIRGQLFLGFIIGVVTGVGLWALDVTQPVALGVFAGLFEMVPILGPWLSFIVAAVVVLATDPGKIWAVGVLFLAVQQLENTFLVPRVQGSAVNMNPAIIMVLLVIGGALWGLLGVIVIVPLGAILRDVFVYVYARLSEEAGAPATAVEASEDAPE